ncbi:MAG: ferritin-like domain-containing protein [Ferruginibacter sp.]
MKSSTKSQSQNGAATSAKSKKTPAKSDAAEGLRDLFEDSLKDIYWAEKALVKALPKMAKNATSEELVMALTEHLEVTKNQVTRLEEVFATLGVKAQAKKCAAMEGLIKEGEEIVESTEEGMVRDAGIISAGQKIEHYEIATYGTLCAFAKVLEETEAGDLLMQTLNEEKEADTKLTTVAESSINLGAADEDEEEATAVPAKGRSKGK